MIPADTYQVKFIADFDGERVYDVEFTAYHPDHVKDIVSAMAAFHSGDNCKCWINGDEVVLDGDWGLL